MVQLMLLVVCLCVWNVDVLWMNA